MGIYNGKSVGYFPSFWEFYFCAKWLVYACMVTVILLYILVLNRDLQCRSILRMGTLHTYTLETIRISDHCMCMSLTDHYKYHVHVTDRPLQVSRALPDIVYTTTSIRTTLGSVHVPHTPTTIWSCTCATDWPLHYIMHHTTVHSVCHTQLSTHSTTKWKSLHEKTHLLILSSCSLTVSWSVATVFSRLLIIPRQNANCSINSLLWLLKISLRVFKSWASASTLKLVVSSSSTKLLCLEALQFAP